MELRDKIARLLLANVHEQTDGRWPLSDQSGLCVMIDDDIDFGKLAGVVLAIPEIAEALKLYENGCQVCEDGRG